MSTGGEVRVVELIQAFLWTCDECGHDNFERAITVSPESIDLENLPVTTFEEAEEIKAFLEEGGEGDFVSAPNRVRCKFCQSEFDTTVV